MPTLDAEQGFQAKIEAARKLNAAKVKELMKTHNESPAEVGTLISCFGIMNTDLRFIQDAPEIKNKVEVQLGPFASFALR
jgi:hypothetical protein